jgi:DNA-binding response OmpR family regulator
MVTRVLVVEPDALMRETVEAMLTAAGYATAGVSDASLAHAALRVSPYPLVVLVGHGDLPIELDALRVRVAMAASHQ